jgi:hypothetical protein
MPIPDSHAAAGPADAGRATAVQGVPLHDIAERFGTPVCVYDADELRRQWRSWQETHPGPVEAAYVVSANPNVSITATARNWCAGAIVSTHTELTSALLSGYAADTIVLDGPLNSGDLVEAALQSGIGAFAVTDVAQVTLLDDAAAVVDRPADVVARLDLSAPAEAEAFLTALVNHPLERVRPIGVCVPVGAITSEIVDLVARLLDQLVGVPLSDRLVVVQPDISDRPARTESLSDLGRVVIATGSPQLRRASTLLARVVHTAPTGPSLVTLDCPLPDVGRPYALLTEQDTGGSGESWTVHDLDEAELRVGDLVATAGVGLLDLPLPIGHILSHGVPAEVLVVDGRAVSIRSAATTEYLLSRQNIMSPTS